MVVRFFHVLLKENNMAVTGKQDGAGDFRGKQRVKICKSEIKTLFSVFRFPYL